MTTGNTDTYQFIRQWHEGDPEGLSALLERHLPWLHEHVRHRLGPLLRRKGETCDYVQDVVVQFLQDGPRFVVSSDEQFRALLLKIVENALRNKHDWFTARRREMARERPLPSDTILSLDPLNGRMKTPSMSAQRHEQEAWVRLGLELVEEKDRELLVLRQWDKLSFAKIGERLGISEGTAQRKHYRAVMRLSDMVSTLRQSRVEDLTE